MDQLTEELMRSFHLQSTGESNGESYSSGPPSSIFDPLTAPSSPEPNFMLGPYQQRRRLLSCIAENWPETDAYNSMTLDCHESMLDTDCFDDNQLQLNETEPFACPSETDDPTDFIFTLDESCILDIESLEDVSEIPIPDTAADVKRPSSSASFVRPIGTNDRSLTKSCYGQLEKVGRADDDDNFGANEINGICRDFIFLNPAFNQGKCRTPLPLTLMPRSVYAPSVEQNDATGESIRSHELWEPQKTESKKQIPESIEGNESEDDVKLNIAFNTYNNDDHHRINAEKSDSGK